MNIIQNQLSSFEINCLRELKLQDHLIFYGDRLTYENEKLKTYHCSIHLKSNKWLNLFNDIEEHTITETTYKLGCKIENSPFRIRFEGNTFLDPVSSIVISRGKLEIQKILIFERIETCKEVEIILKYDSAILLETNQSKVLINTVENMTESLQISMNEKVIEDVINNYVFKMSI